MMTLVDAWITVLLEALNFIEIVVAQIEQSQLELLVSALIFSLQMTKKILKDTRNRKTQRASAN